MKPLEKDELYQNLHGFLKARGVELNEGSYAARIRKGCSLLSDAINAGQHGVSRAKVQIDQQLDQLRQVIHEKTARPGQPVPPRPAGSASAGSKSAPRTKTSKKPTAPRRKPKARGTSRGS